VASALDQVRTAGVGQPSRWKVSHASATAARWSVARREMSVPATEGFSIHVTLADHSLFSVWVQRLAGGPGAWNR
jgi:hypothetical protein